MLEKGRPTTVVVVVHCFGPKQGMLQLCSLHTFQQFMFGMWIPFPTPWGPFSRSTA